VASAILWHLLELLGEENPMILHGRVKDGVVVLQNGATLPDGTLVEITPLSGIGGNALALIAAMEAEPHLSAEDIAELQGAIAAGKRPAAPIHPFGQDTGLP
jgi:hypothetical protein